MQINAIPHRTIGQCCGQLWVRHMFCGWTCDELYHFGESLVLDYTQKSTISTLAVKLSVSAIIYPQVDCHTLRPACDLWHLNMKTPEH